MSRINLRNKPRISYYEPEEPNLDEYVFCEQCADFVFEYCALHGPLLVIPDDKVPTKTNFPSYVPRAALTIPHVFLHLAPSIIPGAGLGVFSTLTLPRGVRFGPYRGQRTQNVESMYCWQIYSGNNKRSHVVDAADAERSNWMRYVNCARHWREQNLLAYQYKGQLYYRTIKTIPRFTELMVFYGSEFASYLRINLKLYNAPRGYAQKFGAPVAKKSKLDKPKENINSKISDETKKTTEADKKVVQDGIKTVTNISDGKNKVSKRNINKALTNTKVQNKENNIKDALNCKNDKNKDFNAKNSNSNIDYLNNTNVSNCQKSFTCDVCSYSCRIKSTLVQHIRIHTGERPFKCDICQRSFTMKINLNKHIRIHTGERPFKCDICQRSFTQKPNLNKHIRIHTGERPFKCDICQRSFTEKPNLNKHIRIHTGERPFKCDICQRSFTLKSSLNMHIRVHTGDRPFKCDICQYSCNQRNNLSRHIRIHMRRKSRCEYSKDTS